MPEVGFRRDELHADVLFTIAGAMDRNNAALHGLSGVVINQDQRLSHQHDVFERKQSAMTIDRLRSRLRAESFAGVCFPVDGQRHRQCYARRAAAFFATEVKQGHFDLTPNLIFYPTEAVRPPSFDGCLPTVSCQQGAKATQQQKRGY